ncbi:MAG: hypothetical protein SFV15_14160 [Polyangiaceae bacterium]|nr:hypothetical protein [Polyangiaceae bacterium]
MPNPQNEPDWGFTGMVAGSLSEHAGKLVLHIARAAERLIDFVASRCRLAALAVCTV